MKNEMLKKIAAVLAVSSLCLSLAACGTKERQSSLVDPSSTESASASADEASGTEDKETPEENSEAKDEEKKQDSDSKTDSASESKTDSASDSGSAAGQASSKQYTAGVNSDNSFESEFIGIRFDVPDGYVLTSQSDIDEQNTANASSGEENLEHMKYEANVVNSDQTFQMIIAVDGEKGDYSEEDYIDIVAQSYTSTTGAEVGAEIGTTDIAGQQYTSIDINMSNSAKMKYCVRKEGDEMITFIFLATGDLDSPMQDMLNAIKKY